MIIESRRTGRTTALIKAALEIGAVFIVSTEHIAKQLRREHGLKLTVYGMDHLPVGTLQHGRAVIYDHMVTEELARRVDNLECIYTNPHYKKVRELLAPLILELDI